MEEFKELYRYRLYEKTHILVNNLDDVFKEIKLFIDMKLKPLLVESDYSKFIFDSIEYRYELDEFKWRIHLKDELSDGTSVPYDKEFIKEDKEFMKILEEEYNISMFPKILYDEAFLVFTEVVSEFVDRNKLCDKIEIYDILTIDNNEENNIIY